MYKASKQQGCIPQYDDYIRRKLIIQGKCAMIAHIKKYGWYSRNLRLWRQNLSLKQELAIAEHRVRGGTAPRQECRGGT